jgi:hypothetical protein
VRALSRHLHELARCIHFGTDLVLGLQAVEQPVSTKENYTVKLQINEGPIDRGIRIVLGVALLAAAAVGLVAAPIVYVTSVVGAVALVTGIVGFCPLYAILRLSTVSVHR